MIQVGMDRSTVELDAGLEPDVVLAAAVAAGAKVVHFEIADPSLEQVFIDYVGHPADQETHLAPVDGEASAADGAPSPQTSTQGAAPAEDAA